MLRLHINLDHPQPRHIQRAAATLRSGGLIVYPSDTTYGLGCDIYSKRSIDRIYQLKGLDRKKPLSFICDDLSQVAHYAVIEDRAYRILRHHTPGKYTFILPATREVPKIVQSNARTVGIRIPESPACTALIRELGHPIISTTVTSRTPEATHMNDADEIADVYGRSIECLLDAGTLFGEPSSVIDLTGEQPVVVRGGSGDLSWLQQT
jgi:tRNA threonylcarbamoyl adenosine modification protein (Sua5/YciO/YrdC/YwlC family)